MNGQIRADSLFLGLTRPTLLFGVSYVFAIVNVMLCFCLFAATHDFKFIFGIIPMHGVGYYFCSKEPLFIELFQVKVSKCMRSRNRMYHGCNSYDPN
ncbi:Type IV secretory pathway, VirB3-like protein [Candidatus Fokinia solitaria]|uniref:Type IV secretory pathway, VirB3-like protein n=1 Tax=Candidatus Fokinia solitaria TaxID=1802984 RepID=A0A2U8BRG6_9RICK|nr:VirB3 family type IV secretion system protein [Candidatus Fokinia solitaria]AWD32931.1 Type IV secretory pathway, VirB3-like protein [Candidatus Fokinia solitaria]